MHMSYLWLAYDIHMDVRCIPVVFTDAGWNGTDHWFGDHRAISVKVPISVMERGGMGTLAYLRSIPRSAVSRVFSNIMHTRGRMQYAMWPGTPGGDAIDVITSGVAAHFIALRNLLRTHKRSL